MEWAHTYHYYMRILLIIVGVISYTICAHDMDELTDPWYRGVCATSPCIPGGNDLDELINQAEDVNNTLDLLQQELAFLDKSLLLLINDEVATANYPIQSMISELEFVVGLATDEACSKIIIMEQAVQTSEIIGAEQFSAASLNQHHDCNVQLELVGSITVSMELTDQQLLQAINNMDRDISNLINNQFHEVDTLLAQLAKKSAKEFSQLQKTLFQQSTALQSNLATSIQSVNLQSQEQSAQLYEEMNSTYAALVKKIGSNQIGLQKSIKTDLSTIQTALATNFNTMQVEQQQVISSQGKNNLATSNQLADVYKDMYDQLLLFRQDIAHDNTDARRQLCEQVEKLVARFSLSGTEISNKIITIQSEISACLKHCCTATNQQFVESDQEVRTALIEMQTAMLRNITKQFSCVGGVLFKRVGQLVNKSSRFAVQLETGLIQVNNKLDAIDEKLTQDIIQKINTVQSQLIQQGYSDEEQLACLRATVCKELCKKLETQATDVLLLIRQACSDLELSGIQIQNMLAEHYADLEKLQAIRSAQTCTDFGMMVAQLSSSLAILIANAVNQLMMEQMDTSRTFISITDAIMLKIGNSATNINATEDSVFDGFHEELEDLEDYIDDSMGSIVDMINSIRDRLVAQINADGQTTLDQILNLTVAIAAAITTAIQSIAIISAVIIEFAATP